MELRIDLSALWKEVRRVSDKTETIDIGQSGVVLEIIDIELGAGKEVVLDDLQIVNGLLSVEGRQVLLFIPDQYRPVDEVMNAPELGNRYHVADCSKLEEMRRIGRFSRYFATNKLDGMFTISGTHSRAGKAAEGQAALKVCKLCLMKVNYQDYNNSPRGQRNSEIWGKFEIADFFNTFSTSFRYLPRGIAPRPNAGTYTTDWKDISAAIRQKCGFRCDDCRLDLSAHKNLLHVHHVNGVKSDNASSNLRPLCADCHRKQPMHERMFITAAAMTTITRLRSAQGLVKGDWNSILELADLSVRGALAHARHKGFPPPEIGYELLDSSGVVQTEIEVAWPKDRLGICLGEAPGSRGWDLSDPVAFMERH